MAQDLPSAADALEERIRHTVLLKKPSVVHALFEGGGVLGKMFPVIGEDWEKKTSIPLGLAIHVKDNASTGGPFGTGISIPDPKDPSRPLHSCTDINRFYDEDCPAMLGKPSLRRLFTLLAFNGVNLAKRVFDPLCNSKDRARIERIKKFCDLLLCEVPDDKKPVVKTLREKASERWLSMKDIKTARDLLAQITNDTPEDPKKKKKAYIAAANAKELANKIDFYIARRSTATDTRLWTIFRRVAMATVDTVKPRLGSHEKHFCDPAIKEDIFKKRMGSDRKLNDLIGSVYYAAYNPKTKSFHSMYSRRDNLLDLNPDAPGIVSHPYMNTWDANMATTANPLIFPPHLTEDGALTIDKATIHTPLFVVSDIFKNKPRDTGIISITFSTGHVVTDDMSDEEIYKFYFENGEAHEEALNDLKACATTEARMALENFIGHDNVFVLSPRMSPKDIDEVHEFPSTDISDASPENMAKIQRRAETYLQDKQEEINRVWQVLADNMYLLGQIDRKKHKEITDRLGIKAALEAEAKARAGNVVQLPLTPQVPSPVVSDALKAAPRIA